jgi:hypothetical protein
MSLLPFIFDLAAVTGNVQRFAGSVAETERRLILY